MVVSPRLGLAYLVASQAQKEVTHNEALNDLDCLVQLSVLGRSLGVAPTSPDEGDAYIVGASAAGEWVGKENFIAYYFSGWHFKTPKTGWLSFVQADAKFYVFNGTGWALMSEFLS